MLFSYFHNSDIVDIVSVISDYRHLYEVPVYIEIFRVELRILCNLTEQPIVSGVGRFLTTSYSVSLTRIIINITS
jgi:hypothetical protein